MRRLTDDLHRSLAVEVLPLVLSAHSLGFQNILNIRLLQPLPVPLPKVLPAFAAVSFIEFQKLVCSGNNSFVGAPNVGFDGAKGLLFLSTS